MNQIILKKYISKLTKQNIKNYLNNQNVNINDNELNTIYYYIKNKSDYFLKGHHQEILNELKTKLEKNTYLKINELYNQYKNKL